MILIHQSHRFPISSIVTLFKELVLQQFERHTLIIPETIWSSGTDKAYNDLAKYDARRHKLSR